MLKLATKLSQLDPRIVRIALFIVLGILTPVVFPQAPSMPGEISG